MTPLPPVGVLYEHPEWFRPLFAEMDRRALPWTPLLAHEQQFDPTVNQIPFGLVLNRVSPSSYLRGHTSAIFFTREYLQHLERNGLPVVNGRAAFELETSKAQQIALLRKLGLPYPRSRVVNHPNQVEGAAAQLQYPIIVKPNIGGSGALIQRFSSPAQLAEALQQQQVDLGPDRLGLVQEYHPPLDGSIVRVEVLDGRFLYAIRIGVDGDGGFNLCPADICQVDAAGAEQPTGPAFDFCAADAVPKRAVRIEAYTPPAPVIDAALMVARAGRLDIAGVEYLQSARDGRRYFYDINALSNFVTDAVTLLGFDPFVRFVDYLERRLESAARVPELTATAGHLPRRG